MKLFETDIASELADHFQRKCLTIPQTIPSEFGPVI